MELDYSLAIAAQFLARDVKASGDRSAEDLFYEHHACDHFAWAKTGFQNIRRLGASLHKSLEGSVSLVKRNA